MLYTQAVSTTTLGILKELMSYDFLESFYLVGGTSIALQKGHRISDDIDLFTEVEFRFIGQSEGVC
jgi:hypothetical protein